MLDIIFLILAFLLLHTYVIFPLTLPIIAEIFRYKPTKKNPVTELPTVSLLISAFNEESVIEKKIHNSLALDYPPEKLQILIGNDGSTDRTAEIVSKYAPQVTLINAPQNQGKAAMLNQLQEAATGEILIFCDANTMFFPNVVRKLSHAFSDEKMGCVCGHLILSDFSGSALGQGESTYWEFESEVKKFQGQTGAVMGGNGAIYAIRKSLYSVLPSKKSVMDDFFITIKVLLKGYKSTFISSAIGTEQTSKIGTGEYVRKVRIGRANFNYLYAYLPLLNPLRPLVAYYFLSHKLLRWFSPQMAIALFVTNFFLWTQNPIYALLFIVQIIFYSSAFIGLFVAKINKKLNFLSTPFYFLTMNFALLKGFFLSFLPEKSGGWVRVSRGDE
ncbi:MAG: glycosyltransferase family 2 protein [Fibrobacter sp.]|nr:glycosyltransferase family 2 protein [Fibrobacter sp.]